MFWYRRAFARLLVLAALVLGVWGQTIPNADFITVVAGASHAPIIAPTSLASIFGLSLAYDTMSSTLDADRTLPSSLLGVPVRVCGNPAALLFVSLGQVNVAVQEGSRRGTCQIEGGRGDDTEVLGVAASGIVAPDGSFPSITAHFQHDSQEQAHVNS